MLIRTPLLGFLLLSQSALAQTPATVSVRVELVAPRYRDRFTDRQAIEAKAAGLFVNYLTKHVGFLRFAVNDSAPAYRLSFLLDRQDRRSNSSFAEVGFYARLEHQGDEPKEKYWLQFRTADQSLAGVGDEAGFLAEIKSKLNDQDPDLVRNEILRWVPFSETGLPNLNPLGVVLPFRLPELCMKKQSVVLFVAEIRGPQTMEKEFKAKIVADFKPPDPPTPELEPFRGGGLGEVIDLTPPDNLTPSITHNAVTVKKIFVTSYEHDAATCNNRVPDSVGTGTP